MRADAFLRLAAFYIAVFAGQHKAIKVDPCSVPAGKDTQICKERKALWECMKEEKIDQPKFFAAVNAEGVTEQFDFRCVSFCDFKEKKLSEGAANVGSIAEDMDSDLSDDFYVEADVCTEFAALDKLPGEKNAHFMVDTDDMAGFVYLLGESYKIVQDKADPTKFTWTIEDVTLVEEDGFKDDEEMIKKMKVKARNLEKFQDLDDDVIDLLYDESINFETRDARRLTESFWDRIDQQILGGPEVEGMFEVLGRRSLESYYSEEQCPPEGRYLKECEKCVYNKQCPKGFVCHPDIKLCINPKGSSCSSPFAGCGNSCPMDEKSCQCEDPDFPNNWVECDPSTIPAPEPIPDMLEVPIQIFIGKNRLDEEFRGNMNAVNKRIKEMIAQMNEDTYERLGIRIKQCGRTKALQVNPPYDQNGVKMLRTMAVCDGGYANVVLATEGGGLGSLGAMPEFGASTSSSISKNGKEDSKTLAHELGHNFQIVHTHDTELDSCVQKGCGSSAYPEVKFPECAYADCFGQSGTIMSYCHACTGGLGSSNKFHSANAELLKPNIWDFLSDRRKLEDRLLILRRQRERRNLDISDELSI